ncbi:type II toxin-antitoxin system RelE/ParE family toxin [Pantoea ananatis]|uniref:type II toxin-antitoxin system RelE/ParE family toxin n=1 Tax=Pantoea ananas TaxID=553 RepID=UPI0021E89600|nr:type II toxin-antitoxin system RelE/ParE family toxin [Pantoea ananatis]MCW0309900.1 Toxin HigB-1 [Pantoea ananatis]MCW0341618.1 Toxin HigB-1 [Pantoea ananatis]MCW0360118.1 Toxin HigB-1 [Pantoea ananatis]MCW0364713.1 Toxin HigB-1 [Pantoea ananatis]MCW1777366.1 type II toxin-antitoxin system RelE/ParE family toxin [Pantoea ananatis]
MIGSFRDGNNSSLAVFYFDNTRSGDIPASLIKPLRRKLSLLESATTENMLLVPPGNHFEQISRNLHGWSGIRVTIQWRMIFQWREGYACELYLEPNN